MKKLLAPVFLIFILCHSLGAGAQTSATSASSCDSLPDLPAVRNWKLSQHDKLVQSAQEMLSQNRVQEAVWDLDEAGETRQARAQKLKLRQMLGASVSEDKKNSVDHSKGGVTGTHKLKLTSGVSVIFKPEDNSQANSITEVAAYALDQLLGLDMVPMTVWTDKKTGGKMNGSLQYFVKGAKDPKDPGVDPNRKNQTFFFFDSLINDFDRYQINFLVAPDHRLVAIDHNSAFKLFGEPSYPKADGTCLCLNNDEARARNSPELIAAIKRSIPRRDVYLRLKHLSDNAIREKLGPYLNTQQMETLLTRKHKILRDINWVTHNGCDLDLFDKPWDNRVPDQTGGGAHGSSLAH